MRFLEKIFPSLKWNWVGTAMGQCFYVDENGTRKPGGERRVYWTLYQRGDGKRRYDVTGDHRYHDSPDVNRRRSQVLAWVHGAPLPPLIDAADIPIVASKKAKLIVFPGGKQQDV